MSKSDKNYDIHKLDLDLLEIIFKHCRNSQKLSFIILKRIYVHIDLV